MLRGLDGFLIPVAWYNCAVLRVRRGLVSSVFGGHSEGETPLPIPNRAVKPLSADGTWPARAWESRSPPVFLFQYESDGCLADMRDVVKFFRANPQVLVLLLICVMLGLGTFLDLIFRLITAVPGA